MNKLRRSLLATLVAAGGLALSGANAQPTIHYFDVTYAAALPAPARYDVYHTAVCIQGLANRRSPRVFLNYQGENDLVWLNRLQESGGLCEGWKLNPLTSLDELLSTFRSEIKGVVLYDADANNGVRSTSLVATTAAGVEDAIAVRKDTSPGSMYNYLVNTQGLPVILDLTGKFTGAGTIWQTNTHSTGSAKCDAYIWAKQHYLANGRCSSTNLAYALDLWGLKAGLDTLTGLSSLDFAVQKRAFCFELSPWGDEKPNDDPTQSLGTDLNTLKGILDSCNFRNAYGRMIKLCGFINWPWKYTSYTGGAHDPVATEWEMMRLLTAYNTYDEADTAPVVNASFYSALAPVMKARRFVQNPPPTYAGLQSLGIINGVGQITAGNYVLVGMGDYDGAAWPMYPPVNGGANVAQGLYDDPARGQAYCNWGIDPNLTDRISVFMDYVYRHKTAKDTFMAWDSGAGYIWPNQLYGSRDPSGYRTAVPAWQQHCREYYRQFNYSITAWLLNGAMPLVITDFKNYAPFSGNGIGAYIASPVRQMATNVPVNTMAGDLSMGGTGSVIDQATGINFGWYRSILWTPTQIKALENQYANSGHNHHFLDAYTYYYLLRYYLNSNKPSANYYRATWVSDTIPRIMAAAQAYPVTVTVRNDGWDTWSEAGGYRLGHAAVAPGISPGAADYDANGHHPMAAGEVAPGQSVTFSFTLTAPMTNGRYDLYYDLVKDGTNSVWFRTLNNIEWKKELIVATQETDVDTDGDGMDDVTESRQGRLYWNPDDSPNPGMAGNPTPPQGATGVAMNPTLTWTAGAGAVSHGLYFGTSFAVVNAAGPASPEYQGNQAVALFPASALSGSSNYFWRVDEIGTSNTIKGLVWNFTTMPPPPVLSCLLSSNGLTLSWPVSTATNYQLERSGLLSSISWTNVDGVVSNQATIAPNNAQEYYRLHWR